MMLSRFRAAKVRAADCTTEAGPSDTLKTASRPGNVAGSLNPPDHSSTLESDVVVFATSVIGGETRKEEKLEAPAPEEGELRCMNGSRVRAFAHEIRSGPSGLRDGL